MKISVLTIAVFMVLAGVMVLERDNRLPEMYMDRVGCQFGSEFYTFDIMIPYGMDKGVYGNQFCDSIRRSYQ